MNAFLAGRKPDFNKFRMRNKAEMEDYLAGYEADLNTPPSMRPGSKAGGKVSAKGK
jgi:naphthoate synthase